MSNKIYLYDCIGKSKFYCKKFIYLKLYSIFSNLKLIKTIIILNIYVNLNYNKEKWNSFVKIWIQSDFFMQSYHIYY